MTDIQYDGNTLMIEEEMVELPHPVKEIATRRGSIIVRLDTVGKSDYSRNVWAFEKDGSLRWKIEEGDEYNGDIPPYVGMEFREGELWVSNWNGYDYEVDLETGELVDQELTK